MRAVCEGTMRERRFSVFYGPVFTLFLNHYNICRLWKRRRKIGTTDIHNKQESKQLKTETKKVRNYREFDLFSARNDESREWWEPELNWTMTLFSSFFSDYLLTLKLSVCFHCASLWTLLAQNSPLSESLLLS